MSAPTNQHLALYFDETHRENQDASFVATYYNIAAHGTDEPLQVFAGPIDPEMSVLGDAIDSLHDEPLRGEVDPGLLAKLDLIQRGHDAMAAERGTAQTMRFAIDSALNTLAYKGERNDFGLTEVRASADRAVKFATAYTDTADSVVQRGLSNLSIYHAPVALYTPDGLRLPGRIEAWGSMQRYGKIGLGLLVATGQDERTVVDVAHGSFELL